MLKNVLKKKEKNRTVVFPLDENGTGMFVFGSNRGRGRGRGKGRGRGGRKWKIEQTVALYVEKWTNGQKSVDIEN